MKFIDLFAGVGGFRTGLEMNGHECVAFCEIDKFARQSYKAIYDTEGEKELHDITQVTDEQWRKYRGSVDIITGGFPCQAFSIAGNRRGFDDTRGTLFFEIARAIKEIQPSYALLENVKGLFSHDKGRTFGTIIQALDELGYVVEWGLFNSKFWGVPQNRERVFILVTRKDVFKDPKLFDLLKQQTEVNTRLVDVLEDEVEEKFYLNDEKITKIVSQLDNNQKIKNGNVIQAVGDRGAHSYSIKDIAFTVPANAMSDRGQHVVDGLPTITVIGNTSNTGYNSHNVHHVEGISPTIAARDYKGPKQIAVPVSTPDSQDRQGEIINPLKDKTSNGWHFEQQVYDPNGISRAVKAGGGSGNIPKTILSNIEDSQELVLGGIYTNVSKEFNRGPLKGLSRTLKANNHDVGVTNGLKIRKLTPLECWRLQGFTDDQFYKAKNAGVSNSQLYKQAGNSVTVNVIDAIAKLF